MTEPLHDFLGIEAQIESVLVRKRVEGPPRQFVTLSIAVGDKDSNRMLRAMLEENLKNLVFVGFGFLQGSLPFPKDDDASTLKVDPATAATDPSTAGLQVWTVPSGDTFLAHHFIRAPGSPTCVICELVDVADLHSDEAIQARDARRAEIAAAAAGDGQPVAQGDDAEPPLSPEAQALIDGIPDDGDDLTDEDRARLAADLSDPPPSEPTEEQQEARRSLASRSRTR